ncbi:Virulence plasmid protein pGP6-D-related protein [Frankliniella fusca]|uniref:Virulence plasmid protein pGP6-D-related protein n=1 Tax=Frankliniella fusca TaxID=407009 RepID=A0AAE1LNC6_9NEOP|nr:Virulence plasmid protein pGP6-D-related protein [Frankliniella fusca]
MVTRRHLTALNLLLTGGSGSVPGWVVYTQIFLFLYQEIRIRNAAYPRKRRRPSRREEESQGRSYQ